MNYEEEFKGLDAGITTYKPKVGVEDIVILEEPQKTEYVASDGTRTPQIKLHISVNRESMYWFIGVGKTTKSIYGQLMALGKHKGKLAGEKITLSVTSSKNSKGEIINSYSVLEAVRVLPLVSKPKEEIVN